MSIPELNKRLEWIKSQPERHRPFYMSRINDKGFWSLQIKH